MPPKKRSEPTELPCSTMRNDDNTRNRQRSTFSLPSENRRLEGVVDTVPGVKPLPASVSVARGSDTIRRTRKSGTKRTRDPAGHRNRA
ncbi:hypothetical protein LSAT2_005140 [Lamellibrachia satsuma]|nr:hypothetical protein LSAT2_005140 [Lamellibrachia satsuma]